MAADAAPIFDAAGNLYGTTQYGGTAGGFGTVFKLDTKGNESVLYSFAGTPDGKIPRARSSPIAPAIYMAPLFMAAPPAATAPCSSSLTPAN